MNSGFATRIFACVVIVVLAITSIGMQFMAGHLFPRTGAGPHVMAMAETGHMAAEPHHVPAGEHKQDCPFCRLSKALDLPVPPAVSIHCDWVLVQRDWSADRPDVLDSRHDAFEARAPPRMNRQKTCKFQSVRFADWRPRKDDHVKRIQPAGAMFAS